MAKRFTDTAKWDHAWFRKLPPKLKCAWFYLVDKCDGAGIWTVDLEAMSFHVGENIEASDLEMFSGKIQMLSFDKLLLLSFIEFQYGKLSDECKPHKPVLERLRKLNLLEAYQKGFRTLEDKEKEKEEEESEEKPSDTELERLYQLYPRKDGKAAGIRKLKTQLKSQVDVQAFERAIEAFVRKHNALGTEPKFIPYFSTFVSNWRECLDDDYGSSTIAAQISGEAKIEWTVEAEIIMQACKRYGFSVDAIQPHIGSRRVALLRAAGGASRLGREPDTAFTVKDLANKLKAAYEISPQKVS